MYATIVCALQLDKNIYCLTDIQIKYVVLPTPSNWHPTAYASIYHIANFFFHYSISCLANGARGMQNAWFCNKSYAKKITV